MNGNTLTAPDAFSFTPQTNVPLNTQTVSNTITVAGINTSPSISIVGGIYNINGGAFTATPGNVVNGDNVTVSLASANAYSTVTSATLTIGGVSATYNVTTIPPTPAAFSFTAQVDVPLDTWIISNTVYLSSLASPTNISIVGGEYSIDDGAYTALAGTVANAQTVTVRVLSSVDYFTTTSTTLTVGAYITNFDATTLVDTVPDVFVFIPHVNVPLASTQTSDTIIVTGLGDSSPISIAGGKYSINGGLYTSVAGLVNNNDTVSVQLIAATTAATNTQAVLTIGGVGGTFNVRTQSGNYDFNGDGISDILWRHNTTGDNIIWKSASSATTQPVAIRSIPDWIVAGIGDFDGDGFSDILWRNNRIGVNTIWLSGDSATTQSVGRLTNLDWTVAGIGDFDGDTVSDILWRNTRLGINTIWKSGNSATRQKVGRLTNLDWTVAGIGDFDGDTASDILWRNTRIGVNIIWLSGNSATTQRVSRVNNLDWTVAGIGDFDGDGVSDILWRNNLIGVNTIWLSANSATRQAVGRIANLDWIVAGVADYDGDGISDILWRNTTTGVDTIWRSANSATRQPVANVGVTAWEVK